MSRPLPRIAALPMALVLLLSLSAAPASAATPSNDDFANAKVIAPAALPYMDQVDASGATSEGAEPASCYPPTRTTWYRIKLPTTAYLQLDTIDSSGSRAGVWRGTTLGGLTLVTCASKANDASSDMRVTWRARANVTYHIGVDSSSDHQVLHVRKVPPPPNDAFAKARLVTGLPRTFVTSLVNATTEPGEKEPSCATLGTTLWYKVRLRSTATVVVDTLLSGFDTFIQQARGTKLGSLHVDVCGDDIENAGNGAQTRIAFRAIAGRTYFVQVGGYDGRGDDLVVRFRAVRPPANDAFASAATITQNGALKEQSTIGATVQSGEPLEPPGCAGVHLGATVWFKFVANATASYDLDTFGSDFPAISAVFSGGPGLGSLVPVDCTNGSGLSFGGQGGTTYWIRVGGFDASNGHLHLHLTHN